MTADLASRVAEAVQDLHAIRLNAPIVIDPASRALADLWAEYRATVAALDAARADLDRAHKALDERDRLRRERESYDCRYAGPYADSGGSHCPLGKPCQRCQLEAAEARATQAEADARRLRAALEAASNEMRAAWQMLSAINDGEPSQDRKRAAVAAGLAYTAALAALAGKEGP